MKITTQCPQCSSKEIFRITYGYQLSLPNEEEGADLEENDVQSKKEKKIPYRNLGCCMPVDSEGRALFTFGCDACGHKWRIGKEITFKKIWK